MTAYKFAFKIGTTVQLKKDVPSLGLAEGTQLEVFAHSPAFPPSMRCPTGLRESYGLKGYGEIRFPVELLEVAEKGGDA